MPRKHYRHLCEADRATIERMRKEGKSQEEIGRAIGFSQATVSKELRRNRGLRGYRHKQAEGICKDRKASKRSRPRKLVGKLREEVEERLSRKHSPEQISGSLTQKGLEVSHETIYTHIASDKQAGGELYRDLRINNRKRRRPRVKAGRERIVGRKGLEERPKVVDARRRFGDWEADLIEGSKGSGFVLSLYERKSQFCKLVKLATKSSRETADAIIETLVPYQVHTITYDNGLEFSEHRHIAECLGGEGYFCAPYHSWEKGGVENLNGLVRQYYPKGMDFSSIMPQELAEKEREINARPRKSLGYLEPADLEQKLAA